MCGVLARLRRRWLTARAADEARDSGLTLVEVLFAMVMITVGVLGLLNELASDIKQQTTERAQTNAVHLATSDLEAAKANGYSKLTTTLLGSTTSTLGIQGVNYSHTTLVQLCSASDAPAVCTTPAAGAASVARVTATVNWTTGNQPHSVHMTRNYADTSTSTLTGSVNPLGSCGGGGTTLVSGTLSLSPSTVYVDAAGHPTQNVTATLTQSGLLNATCVPLTWSDDSGSHQVSMSKSGSNYTYTITTSSITKAAASSSGTVTFKATVPGSQAVPSASLTIGGTPAFGTCSVSVAGLGLNTITLNPLTRKSLLASTVTCTTTNLSSTDSVKLTYQSGASGNNTTVNLSSTNGTTWTATLASGTQLASSGTSTTFNFSLKRTADNATATKTLTVTLA